MFDLGFAELLVIGIVALIVVGPKDLPGMFRTLGRFTAKARGMAREFQRAMNDAADQSGIKDTAATLKNATSPKSRKSLVTHSPTSVVWMCLGRGSLALPSMACMMAVDTVWGSAGGEPGLS